MPDAHDDLVAVLRAHGNGGERPSRPASAQAADRLEELAERVAAYRTAALHYMDNRTIVVDRRGGGRVVTWGVGGREATPAEFDALADLCAEMGEPFEEDDDA